MTDADVDGSHIAYFNFDLYIQVYERTGGAGICLHSTASIVFSKKRERTRTMHGPMQNERH
jgi:DNA gyrase/topoisomerase IV subunit B